MEVTAFQPSVPHPSTWVCGVRSPLNAHKPPSATPVQCLPAHSCGCECVGHSEKESHVSVLPSPRTALPQRARLFQKRETDSPGAVFVSKLGNLRIFVTQSMRSCQAVRAACIETHTHPRVSVRLMKSWQARWRFSEAPGVNRNTKSHVVGRLMSTRGVLLGSHRSVFASVCFGLGWVSGPPSSSEGLPPAGSPHF